MYVFSVQFCLKHFWFKDDLSEIWSKMYIGLMSSIRYVKYPLCQVSVMSSIRYFCQIKIKLDFFFDIFSKNNQISNFVDIGPLGA